MTEKGFCVLKAICNSGFNREIEQVICSRDRNLTKDYFKEIKSICESFNIPFYDRSDNYEITAQYIISVSWRWLIKNTPAKLIVLHDSILPKYRGFAPLVNQLIQKEPYIGVSALFASDAYDEGNLILQKKINVEYPIKIQQAINLITPLYKDIVLQLFSEISLNQPLNNKPQNEEEATYSLWRDQKDYFIDWDQPSERIVRFIDAVGPPYDGAQAHLNGALIKIWDSESIPDKKIINRDIGKVLFVDEGYPIVVCGSGLLKITKAQYLQSGGSIIPLKKFRSRFT
jgi:methionyl-tRNA formyltransferase